MCPILATSLASREQLLPAVLSACPIRVPRSLVHKCSADARDPPLAMTEHPLTYTPQPAIHKTLLSNARPREGSHFVRSLCDLSQLILILDGGPVIATCAREVRQSLCRQESLIKRSLPRLGLSLPSLSFGIGFARLGLCRGPAGGNVWAITARCTLNAAAVAEPSSRHHQVCIDT